MFLAFQLGIESNLGLEQLGNRTPLLGLVRGVLKGTFIGTGTTDPGAKMNLGNTEATRILFKGNGRLSSDTLWRQARFSHDHR